MIKIVGYAEHRSIIIQIGGDMDIFKIEKEMKKEQEKHD